MPDGPVRLACNLCGDGASAARVGEAEGVDILRCGACGLFRLSSRLADSGISGVYSRDFYGPAGADPSPAGPGRRSRGLRRRLAAISRHTGKPGRLLDVGCGTGEFLAEARDSGWDAQGLEVSSYAAARARARHGLPVAEGELSRAGFGPGSFDLVTLFDVFSHMRDPLGGFIEIRRILRPGGVLAFSTGDYALLPEELYGPRWGRTAEHYWKLDRKSLGVLLGKSGFEPLRVESLARLPLSPKSLARLGLPLRWLAALMSTPYGIVSEEVLVIARPA